MCHYSYTYSLQQYDFGAIAIDDVGNDVEHGTKNDYGDDDENVEVFPEVIQNVYLIPHRNVSFPAVCFSLALFLIRLLRLAFSFLHFSFSVVLDAIGISFRFR